MATSDPSGVMAADTNLQPDTRPPTDLKPPLEYLSVSMDVVRLIRMVKARAPLWDRKNTYYHDHQLTMALWTEVADALGFDVDSIRAKWKGLRDTFRGELKKVNKMIMRGDVNASSTGWEYFQEMSFVRDQIYLTKTYAHKRQLISLAVPPADCNDDSEPCIDTTVYLKTEVLDFDEPSQKHIRKEDELSADENTSHMRDPLSTKADIENPDINDDNFNFMLSILPQLRSLPLHRNLFVRLKIQELLYNELVAGELKQTCK